MKIKNLFSALVVIIFMYTPLCGQNDINGTVKDKNSMPLVSVSIYLDGTVKGTLTDFDGSFSISNVKDGNYQLMVSYIGYKVQKVPISVPLSSPIEIILQEDSAELDEIIVTGVFDKRSKMSSSVAISSLNAEQLGRVVALSAADVLKNTPGVYVNSAAGEVRNTVYARGISANSNGSITETVNGYYYVSLQEDGLPVIAFSDGLLVADLFFRNDATIKRLEAVRGGTSSITSVNAPGGIFNFLSKTGLDNLNEIRYRTGLEGDVKNLFNRLDVSYGKKINEQWHYNIGGFYRHAEGARYPGYALNDGGQIKASITNDYDKGSFRVYTKYLNDKNGLAQTIPAVGFDDIKLAPGINFQDSYLLPAGPVEIPDAKGGFKTFDPKNANRTKDFSIGLNFNHNFNNNWTIGNNAKYSKKDFSSQTNSASSFTSLLDPSTFFFTGTFGPDGSGSANVPGRVTFRDRTNGQVVAVVDQEFTATGPSFTIIDSNLPDAVDNSLLYHGSILAESEVSEFMDQFSIAKKWDNTSINAGVFYSNSKIDIFEQRAPTLGLSLIEDQPQLLDITFEGANGQSYALTNAQGYSKLGGGFGFTEQDYTIDQLAFFFGNNFTLANDKLNIDWGFRVETSTVSGTIDQSEPNPLNGSGGLDGNPNTLYDNFSQVLGTTIINFDKSISGVSYSAGVNYQFDDKNAVYVRYSRGQKAPDLRFYATYTSEFAAQTDPTNQNITQIEAAYKLRSDKLNATITPFYSLLSDVTSIDVAGDDTNQLYFTPPVINSVETTGVEIEFDWSIHQNFSVRGGATFQTAKQKDWQIWNIGNPTRDDDVLVDFSGERAENNPDVMFNITPTYSRKKFYSFLQYNYIGNRAANQPNAYEIPGFGQLDLGLGYDLSEKLNLAINVNNFMNTFGIMSSFAPGSIRRVFSPNTVTKETVQNDPNAVHPVIAIQPRSLFVTLAYKL